MKLNPSKKTIGELRKIVMHSPIPAKDLEYAYYEMRIDKHKLERFRILTGFTQCQGSLVVHGGDIIQCCCREMAFLIASRGAQYFRGRICVPSSTDTAFRYGNEYYVVMDEIEGEFVACPFCNTEVEEMVHFTDDTEGE